MMSRAETIDPKVIQSLRTEVTRLQKIWRQRRNQCREMVGNLAEGMDKKDSEVNVSHCAFAEEVGDDWIGDRGRARHPASFQAFFCLLQETEYYVLLSKCHNRRNVPMRIGPTFFSTPPSFPALAVFPAVPVAVFPADPVPVADARGTGAAGIAGIAGIAGAAGAASDTGADRPNCRDVDDVILVGSVITSALREKPLPREVANTGLTAATSTVAIGDACPICDACTSCTACDVCVAGRNKSFRRWPLASTQCLGREVGLCAIDSFIQSNMPSFSSC